MSVETIAVVISAASLVLTFAAGFAWLIRRTDTQLATLADRFSSEIGKLRTELRADIASLRTELRTELGGDIAGLRTEFRTELRSEIGGLRKELSERLSGVEREMVEVKIAIARLEGPGRHLVAAR